MPVMVRVKKFKNFHNKACLPSLLSDLMSHGYFGGDFLILFALGFCNIFFSGGQNPKAKKIIALVVECDIMSG